MHRAAVFVSVGALLASSAVPTTGAEQRVDAQLTGAVVTSAGEPVGGAALRVHSTAGTSERFAAGITAAFTAGLSCFVSDCFGGGSSGQATAGGDGRYSLTLPKAHTPGVHLDDDWFVYASDPKRPPNEGGPLAYEEFEVLEAPLASPDLVLWAPTLTVAADPQRLELTWATLEATRFQGRRASYELRLADQEGNLLWRVPRLSPGRAIDARLVEATAATATLVATVDVVSSKTIYHQTMVAPRQVLALGAEPPLSRQAPCQSVPPAPGLGCWLTDGAFGARRPGPPSCPSLQPPPELKVRQEPCQPTTTAVTVDLGRTTELGLVVVRGSCGGCDVATSSD
ncbi:MAG: hypothetical protein M3394_05295, partial [Actinomycetota bacterium]|nr:hypothetical protein [Actinomycetota bacterium]